MNRQELVGAVAGKTGLTAAQASEAISALVSAVSETLAAGQSVTVPGFGTFERRHRAARTGRNPQTGAAIEISASVVPAFKPAAGLKRAVADS